MRAWRAGGRRVHHLIDPRTGAPVESELLFATVAAPTILEADLAAKLLILGGTEAAETLDERCLAVVTDREGRIVSLKGGSQGRATGGSYSSEPLSRRIDQYSSRKLGNLVHAGIPGHSDTSGVG